MTKIFVAPVKRANWSVHYLESGGQSARGNPLCEIEIAMGSAKEGPREESDRFLSLFRRRSPPPPSSTPIPGPHNNGHHVATKAKHPKYWRKSRHSVAVDKWDEMWGYTGRLALLNISLGSNLSCLVRIILLHGQTVTFLALSPSIVESFEREGTRVSLSLSSSRSRALPLQLPFYSALSELRVSLSRRRRWTTKAPTPLDGPRLVRLTPKSGVRCASLGAKGRAAVNTNGTPPRVVVATSATLSSGSSSRALCKGTTRQSGTSNSHRW